MPLDKLPVPDITLSTQDVGSVFQSKMNDALLAVKNAILAFNAQVDAGNAASQLNGVGTSFKVNLTSFDASKTPSQMVALLGDGVTYQSAAIAIGGQSPETNGVMYGYANSSNNYSYCYQEMTGITGIRYRRTANGANAWNTWRKVLEGGDFGIGRALDLRPQISNLWQLYDTPQKCFGVGTIHGFIDGLTLGIPGFSGTSYGVIKIHGQYSDFSGGSGVQQTFTREGITLWRTPATATTWTAWNVVGAPVLGSVANASGLSTGSVIERGGNPSGEYTKFADGLMLQLYNYNEVADLTTQEGAIFRNPSMRSWTFPTVFAPGWPVIVTGQFPSCGAWLSQRTNAPDQVSFYWQSAVSATYDGVAHLCAIGRWRS